MKKVFKIETKSPDGFVYATRVESYLLGITYVDTNRKGGYLLYDKIVSITLIPEKYKSKTNERV
jgi:hypothetical protein